VEGEHQHVAQSEVAEDEALCNQRLNPLTHLCMSKAKPK
jgi:hypothetical protein